MDLADGRYGLARNCSCCSGAAAFALLNQASTREIASQLINQSTVVKLCERVAVGKEGGGESKEGKGRER